MPTDPRSDDRTHDRTDPAADGQRAHRAGAFDIRVFIGALLGLYALVLLLTSVFGTTQEELDRAGGVDVNLWTGLALLVSAAAFVGWARLRPVVVPDDPATDAAGDGAGEQAHADDGERRGSGR